MVLLQRQLPSKEAPRVVLVSTERGVKGARE
jgi:hypothetical protein